jgi:diguanylate cyclase (GGDEF)-like protein
MLDIVDSVARLTALRDRDELELIVVTVMFDLIRPSKLILWRLVSHSGELRLHPRVKLGPNIEACIFADGVESELLDFRADLRTCYDKKLPLHFELGKGGHHRYVFPVLGERGVSGFLELQRRHALGKQQERLVNGLLRIYRNHLRILDYSEYDELTGLLNRKTFSDYFEHLIRSAPAGAAGRSTGLPSSHSEPSQGLRPWLAVADVDFFKRINDRFGHLYGDEVLVLLARQMRGCFGEHDRLFRSGGEEFIVILGHADPTGAARSLEAFRAAVAAIEFPQIGSVTVSIGYTRVADNDHESDAFGRADEALYIAKQRGRNQVLCYEDLISQCVLQSKILSTSEVEMF